MTRLIEVAYLSETSSDNIEARSIATILMSAQRQNVANDITGALACGNGHFVQVLEGPEAAVLATLKRIERDPRHHSLQIVGPRQIVERSFPDWCMAHLAFEPHLEPALASLISNWPTQGSQAARILSRALEA